MPQQYNNYVQKHKNSDNKENNQTLIDQYDHLKSIAKGKNNNENNNVYNENKYHENIQKFKDSQKKEFLHNNKDKIKKILDDSDNHDNKVTVMKLKDVLDDVENNEVNSINNMRLSKEDRLVFIFVTFLIRQLNLWLIDWGLYTNFITTFTNAFILYIVLYTIFLLIILCIVNITYNISIFQLYMRKNGIFSTLASSLYYFYLIPGYTLSHSMRFIFHLGVIYTAVIIALVIKQRDDPYDEPQHYNYEVKKNIKRFIGDFTLIIWLFLAFATMYMF